MHIKKFITRSISLLCILMLFVSVTPLAHAVGITGTLANSGIILSSTENVGTAPSGTDSAAMEASWAADGTTLTGSVTPGSRYYTRGDTYYLYKGANSILTITNNLGAEGDEAILSFGYTEPTAGGTISFSDNVEVDGYMVSATLKYGESVTITLTTAASPSSSVGSDNRTNYTTTTTLSGLDLVAVNAGIKITLNPIAGGSYTVSDGVETKTMGDSFTNPLETTYTLTAAEPEGNYHFSGWSFNGVTYSDASMTLTGIKFNADTTVEALYTLDPMYAIASPVGNVYVDDLVGFNSRYYHDTRTDKTADSVQRSNNSSCYYSAGGTTNGTCDTQYLPTLQWGQSSSTITVTKNGTSTGEYETFATSHAYANMVTDMIRIYGKQDSIISFDYSFTCSGAGENTPAVHVYVSTSGSEKIATVLSKGTAYGTDTTSVTQTLAKGSYMYIYTNGYYHSESLKIGGKNTTFNYKFTSTISNVKVQANDTRYIQTTTFKDNTGNGLASGKLAISGVNYAVGANGVVSIPSMPDGQTMLLSVATVPTNYRLIGWEVDGVLHYTSTYAYDIKANTTINPIFVPNQVTFNADTATYQYKNISGTMVDLNGQYVARNADATVYYKSLAEGFADSGEVVLLGNMTINGNFEIPSGEVLVVPCAMKDVISKDSSGTYIPVINKGGSGVWATLTLNGNMTVNGVLIVGGQQAASGGARAGSYGVMNISSGKTVTVNSGTALYGYGLVKGAGNILVKSNAKIHELCEVKDFPYPVITELLNSNADKYQVMPFNSYYMNSIEAKTTYEVGASLEGHLSITYDYTSQEAFPVIGENNGILLVKSGSVTKYFDSAAKQIVFRVNEDATVESGSFTASITASLGGFERTATVVSGKFFLPLSAGYQFVVAGNLNMKHDLKMLPGSKLNVLAGGVLTIEEGADLVFYRLNDYDYRKNNSTNDEPLGFSAAGYPVGMTGYSISRSTIGSAKMHVDGDVIVKGGLYVTNQLRPEQAETDTALAFKNYSYYANGYNNLTGGGTIDMTAAQNSISQINEHQINNYDKANINITQVAVIPIKGLPSEATADEPAQYVSLSGKMMGSINDSGLNVWSADPCAAGHTPAVDAAVDATCTETGLTEGSHCSVCNEVITAQEEIPALGHTEVTDEAVAATCTSTGLTEGKHCSVCNEVLVAQEETKKLDHVFSVELTDTKVAATCIAEGSVEMQCATCTETETKVLPIDKSAHTGNTEEIPAIPASCKVEGFTAGTKCAGCKEVLTAPTSLGYDSTKHLTTVDVAEVPATCQAGGFTAGKQCSDCEVYTEGHAATEKNPNNHVGATEVIPAVEATCKVEGFTAGVKCLGCGNVKSGHESLGYDEDNHKNVTTTTVDPTCTDTGSVTKTCDDCGTTISETTTPATGHSYTSVVTPPTCTDKGYTTYTCSACGDTYKDDEVAATGHKYTAVVTAPTCTAAGYTTYTCACGDTYTGDEVAATGHKYNGIVTTEPGCETTGVKTFTCGTCGDNYTEEIAATGHTYDAVVTAPTCTEEGYTTYTCACGDTYTDNKVAATGHTPGDAATCTTPQICTVCGAEIAPATGHTYGEWTVTKAPTCTETGTKVRKCACSDEETETVAATGHSYESVVTAPTCTEKGFTTHTCSACGDSYKDTEVAALGHSYESVVTAPTCTEKGFTTHTCSACGNSYTDTEVDATGHTPVVDNAVAPDCTNTGLTEGSHCDVCNAVLVAQEVVPALGHSYDDGVITTVPTCNDKGVKTFTCSACGDTYTEAVDATGHTPVVDNAVAPDCTNTGLTEGSHCDVCGHVIKAQEIVPALGHKYEAVVTAPTCTEAGYTTYTCSVCGDTYTGDNVDALGHKYETVVTAPTCTAKGFTTYTCSVCGDTYTADEVDALGHTEKAIPAVDPTCTATGLKAGVKCSVCGETLTAQEVVPALGHSLNEGVYTEPTFEADGYTTYTCTRNCGYSEVDTDEGSKLIAVAMIGEKKFVSLQAAMDAAVEGDKIVLLSKYTVSGDEIWDLTGKTLVIPAVEENYGIVVKGNLTIKGGTYRIKGINGIGVQTNGSLTVNGGVFGYEGANDYMIGNWGTTVINDVTINGNYCCINNFAGTTTVKSGSFSTDYVLGEGEDFEVADILADTGVTISGGTFSKQPYDELIAEGYCAQEIDNGYEVKAHVPGDAVKENEQKAACEANGSYDSVVSCTKCGTELSRETVVVEATGHSYETVVTDPTCTVNGYTTHTCSVCGNSYTDTVVPAIGHSYSEKITNAPTCTAAGLKTFTCGNCSHSYTEPIAALGHTAGTAVTEITTPATCTAEGSYDTVVSCSVCKAELSRVSTTINALGHKYESVVTDPTCTAGGYTTYTCSNCDDSYTADNVAATGHAWDEGKVTTDPTCTEAGVKTYTCGTCGETKTEAVAATGHSYGSVVTPPTCTEAGYTTYTCACGDTYKGDEVAKLGHTEVIDAAVAPDCESTGLTEGKHCSVCGEVIKAQETVGALGHDYEGIVTTEPTCTEKGVKTYTCKNDASHTYTEEVAAAGHTLTQVEAKAATCEAIGWNAYEYCSDCDYTTYKEIAALEHDYEGVVTTQPTCTATGVKTYTCKNDASHTYTEEVAVLGHDEVSHEAKAPTCTEKGWDAYVTCSRCDYTTYAEKAATGHTEVEIPAVDATCTTAGATAGVKCSVCGEILTTQEEIPVLGHSYNTGVVTTEPTCSEDGVMTYTCGTCGDSYTEVIDATGEHSFTKYEVTTEATFEANATEKATCDNCDATDTREIEGTQLIAVAEVAGQKYTTLAEAVEKAEAGATVTLLNSTDETVTVSKALTINKDAFTATITAGEGYELTEADGVVTVAEKAVDPTVPVPTTNKHSVNCQIGLIEPWFLRINFFVRTPEDVFIDPTTFTDYGAYAIRMSDLENADSVIKNKDYESILNNAKMTAYNKGVEASVHEEDNHAMFPATVDGIKGLSFRYRENIYTYEMGDPIVFFCWYVDSDGLHYTPIVKRSIIDLVNQYSEDEDFLQDERDVYINMSKLYEDIVAHRGSGETTLPSVELFTIGQSDLGAPTTSTKYKFSRSRQIVLIEPWGLRINARARTASDNLTLDYSKLDDYGIIVYHAKNNIIPKNAEEMLSKQDAYVFSKQHQNVSVENVDGYPMFCSRYRHNIYTYELNSSICYMFYIKVDNNYIYSTVVSDNIKELAATRAVDTSGAFSKTEQAVYKDLVSLYEVVTAYREPRLN